MLDSLPDTAPSGVRILIENQTLAEEILRGQGGDSTFQLCINRPGREHVGDSHEHRRKLILERSDFTDFIIHQLLQTGIEMLQFPHQFQIFADGGVAFKEDPEPRNEVRRRDKVPVHGQQFQS